MICTCTYIHAHTEEKKNLHASSHVFLTPWPSRAGVISDLNNMLKQQSQRERQLALMTPSNNAETTAIHAELVALVAQHECSLDELKLVIEDQKIMIAEKENIIQDSMKAVDEREHTIQQLQSQLDEAVTHTIKSSPDVSSSDDRSNEILVQISRENEELKSEISMLRKRVVNDVHAGTPNGDATGSESDQIREAQRRLAEAEDKVAAMEKQVEDSSKANADLQRRLTDLKGLANRLKELTGKQQVCWREECAH
jgi:hypothetical protein